MIASTLLTIPATQGGRDWFSFDHAMNHRSVMVAMAPLSQWSAMPYWIDPMRYDARPATWWPLQHQQAHNDFTDYLPAYGTALTEGIPTAQIMIDSNLGDPGSREWWLLANQMEHQIANSAMFPLPLSPMAPPPATFALPWWIDTPRFAANYW